MAAERFTPGLIDRLPRVRGRLTASAPLDRMTWFRVGGPAEVLFEPADAADIATMMRGLPPDVSLNVIGLASNLLVRDAGVPGVVVRLGKAFGDIQCDGATVRAGAGAADKAATVGLRPYCGPGCGSGRVPRSPPLDSARLP